jgi:hypothetical protein
MTIANPLVITINAVAKNLAKINNDNYGSEYLLQSSTEEWRMKIRHSNEAVKGAAPQMARHNVEFTHTVYATSTVPAVVTQIYSVIRNTTLVTDADLQYMMAGFVAFFDATHTLDLRGWQN